MANRRRAPFAAAVSLALALLLAATAAGGGMAARASTPVCAPPDPNDFTLYHAVDDTFARASSSLTVPAPGLLANDTEDVFGVPQPIHRDDSHVDTLLWSGAAHGTVTLNADGSFAYTASPGYNGDDSFVYIDRQEVSLKCSVTTAQVTILGSAIKPVAQGDAYSVRADEQLIAPPTGGLLDESGVLLNDTDNAGGGLDAMLVTAPAKGTVTLQSNGSFTYTPPASALTDPFNTTAYSFTYKACEMAAPFLCSDAVTDRISLDLTIGGVADAYSVNENTALSVATAAAGVLANDHNNAGPGTGLKASVVTQPSHGTVSLASDGTFSYHPAANFVGVDVFTYLACSNTYNGDVHLVCSPSPATVSITVNPVDAAPVALPDSALTPAENLIAVNVLSNDSDADGPAQLGPPSYAAVVATSPSHGAVSAVADGSLRYTPNAGYSGSDSFTYKACEMSGATPTLCSPAATVSLSVTVPLAVADQYTTALGSPVDINPLLNDSDPYRPGAGISLPTYAVFVLTAPRHGALDPLTVGFPTTYTPNPGFIGKDSFTYQFCDGLLGDCSGSARVTIAVKSENLVKDGGFEKPAATGIFQTLPAGAKIGAWTVLSGSVDLVTSPADWQAAAGSQSLDLNGNDSGAISQTLHLPAAGTYRIRLSLAGNPSCGGGVKTLKVFWNGTLTKALRFDSSASNAADMGWVSRSVAVTGTAGADTLEFASATPGSCGPVLDKTLVQRTG